MRTTWIDTPDELERFCEKLDGQPIAVDTESDHFHAYQAQVCLIQVGTAEESALIDPLAMQAEHLAPLFDVFEDPDVITILHAGRNDIIELDRDYSVGISNLFDTQIAARFLGYERNSLSWLQEELLGVAPGKQFQRFDWTTRPIPEEACKYAADDVLHLLDLRERFLGELAEDGWLDAFEEQCEFVSTTVAHEPKPFDPEGWRGIRGADKLDGRGRAALRALYLWRHELCTEVNRAAVTVFNDSALLRVAQKRPKTTQKLSKIRGVPRPIVDNHADTVLGVVERSLQAEIPVERLPRPAYEPQPAEEKAIYDALRRWRNKKAEQIDLPGPFLATNATLTEIAKQPPHNLDELGAFEAILDWHVQMMGDEILRVIADAV